MPKTTIFSIAKKTGFSASTISRVLSGQGEKYRISESTIAKIKEEAKLCNYTPSLLARSLRIKKTNTIGLVLPSIDNPFFANIASIITKEAKSKGYTIILSDTLEDENSEEECIESLTSRNIDGAIIISCREKSDLLESVSKQRMPIVLIDRYFKETSLPYVSTDNYFGATLATNYLIENGHKNIACIQGNPSTMPVKRRVEGYKDCMKKHNLSDFIFISGNSFSIENGYIETLNLLNKKERPTAIFTLSNTITLGAYKAIKESGLKIPSDISIICFDNHLYLDYIEPTVTRIAQPIDEMGVLATKILLEKIDKKNFPEDESTYQLLLAPTLIMGKSVLNKNTH